VPCPEAIRSFAQELREYLKKETAPAFELVGASAKSFNIGYGFTTTAWNCCCAIIIYRKHINISFPSGAVLSDPEELLHGTGTRVRHLKIQQLRDMKTPAVKNLLKQARKNALNALEDREQTDRGVRTVIRKPRKPAG
jgi:SOS response regulatory protein OraA/RecX